MYEEVKQIIAEAMEEQGYEVEIDGNVVWVIGDDDHGVKVQVSYMS